jgi:hypothetical protein
MFLVWYTEKNSPLLEIICLFEITFWISLSFMPLVICLMKFLIKLGNGHPLSYCLLQITTISSSSLILVLFILWLIFIVLCNQSINYKCR